MWELGPWKTKYQKGDSGPGTTLFISAEIVVFFCQIFTNILRLLRSVKNKVTIIF